MTETSTPLNFGTATIEDSRPAMVIQPLKGWIPIDWQELIRYRELLYFLIWRDIKVRYKQAILGGAWAVFQPLINAILFTLIFNVVFKLGSDLPPGVAYTPYVFAALIPWLFFSNAVSVGGQVLINQQHMITKIYFPRIFLPTAAVGANWVDMLISLGVLFLMMPLFGMWPSWQIIFLPFLIGLTIIMSLGLVYLLSALTVMYRDFKFITPFLIQLMSYASFVQYPPDKLLEKHEWVGYVAALNPMFGVVMAFRAAIIGHGLSWHLPYLAISTVVSLALLGVGLFYFRKTERRFADVA